MSTRIYDYKYQSGIVNFNNDICIEIRNSVMNTDKIKKLSIQEHVKICNMMNHSYEENKKYAYVI